jgi:hypothetical protein
VKVLGFLSPVSVAEKQEAVEQAADQHQQQQEPAVDGSQDATVPSDYMALLSVSLLWGSYTPALRYLYSMDSLLTPQVCCVCGMADAAHAWRVLLTWVAVPLWQDTAPVVLGAHRKHSQACVQQTKTAVQLPYHLACLPL